MTSTAQNMRFLEAELDRYLHTHEAISGSLYVVSAGIRLPYNGQLDNLEKNMKYVEVQLDRYLHSHVEEGTPAEDQYTHGTFETLHPQGPNDIEIPFWRVLNVGGTLELSFYWPLSDPTFSTPVSLNMADNKFLVCGASDGLNDWWISSTNPADGTWHLRSGGTENATMRLNFGNKATGIENNLGPVGFDIVEGAEWELTFDWSWFDSDLELVPVMTAIIYTGNAAGWAGPYLQEFTPTTTDGTYESESWTWTFEPGTYDASHTMFAVTLNASVDGVRINGTIDLDNVVISGAGSDTMLYTAPVGFRFPYDWKRPGAINDNRRFLEEQLSQYLHSHDEET